MHFRQTAGIWAFCVLHLLTVCMWAYWMLQTVDMCFSFRSLTFIYFPQHVLSSCNIFRCKCLPSEGFLALPAWLDVFSAQAPVSVLAMFSVCFPLVPISCHELPGHSSLKAAADSLSKTFTYFLYWKVKVRQRVIYPASASVNENVFSYWQPGTWNETNLKSYQGESKRI